MKHYVARYLGTSGGLARYEFFSGGSWVDHPRLATPYPTEDAAVAACETLARVGSGPFTVCSEDEFE